MVNKNNLITNVKAYHILTCHHGLPFTTPYNKLILQALPSDQNYMNIREELLKEKIHTKEHALIITDYACSSEKKFKELMQCFLSNEYRLAQRAAWSVSWAAQKQPHLIQPYIKNLIEQLLRKDVHDAVIRNSVRILQKINIPEEIHGELMNICFSFIESDKTPVAIKAFALTTVFNLSKIYPDIQNELRLLIEERWNYETAAFKQRGKQILQNLNKIK